MTDWILIPGVIVTGLMLAASLLRFRRIRERNLADQGLGLRIARLSVLRVPVSQVFRKQYRRGLLAVELTLQLEGSATLEIDMTRAKLQPAADGMPVDVLNVPDPVAGDSFIDFEKTEVIALSHRHLLGYLWPGAYERVAECLEHGMKTAQQQLRSLAADDDLIAAARVSFEQAVDETFRELGRCIQVKWTRSDTRSDNVASPSPRPADTTLRPVMPFDARA